MAWQTYFIIVGTGGLTSVIVREATKQPDEIDSIASCYLLITVGLSGIVCLFSVVGTYLAPISSAERFVLIAIAVSSAASSMSFRPLFDARHQQAMSAAILFFSHLTSITILVIAYQTERLDLRTAGVIISCTAILSFFVHLAIYYFFFHRVRWSFSRGRLVDLLKSSAWLLLVRLVGTLPLTGGIIWVRIMHGDEDAAILGIVDRVLKAYLTFSLIAVRIVQPHMSGPYGMHRSFVQKAVIFSASFHVVLMVAIGVAAATAILLFLDPVYHAAVGVMVVALLAGCFAGMGTMGTSFLVTRRKESVVFSVNVIRTTIFVALATPLVWQLSYLGAPLASLVSTSAAFVVIVGIMRRYKFTAEKTSDDADASGKMS